MANIEVLKEQRVLDNVNEVATACWVPDSRSWPTASNLWETSAASGCSTGSNSSATAQTKEPIAPYGGSRRRWRRSTSPPATGVAAVHGGESDPHRTAVGLTAAEAREGIEKLGRVLHAVV